MGSNADVVREAYRRAEGPVPDAAGFRALFSDDGVFNPMFADVDYRGSEIGDIVSALGQQISNVHRELLQVHELDDVVAVELVITGSFRGPMETPAGVIERPGVPIEVPCGDFWYLHDGKITQFNCYLEQSVLLEQVGAFTSAEPEGSTA